MTLIRGLRIIETDAGVVAADEHHVTGVASGDFVSSLAAQSGSGVHVGGAEPARGATPWVWYTSGEVVFYDGSDAPTAPDFTVSPVITGTGVVGDVLSCGTGTATGTTPITRTYQWKNAGTNIGGATSASYTVQAGDVGDALTCTVTATNDEGSDTATSNAITGLAAPTAPGQPTGLGATPGDAQVALSWTAPASNGGSAITDYTVEYRTPAGSGSYTAFSHSAGTATSRTVTGLTNASEYEFRVSAVNAVGTGTPSATATATPVSAGATLPTAGMWADYDPSILTGVSNGDTVTSLLDASGNSRTATKHSSSTPTVIFNSLGSNRAILFDGGADYFELPTIAALTQGAILAVMKLTLDPPVADNLAGLWHFGASTDNDWFAHPNGNIYESFGSTDRQSFSRSGVTGLDQWFVYSVRSKTNDWEARINGETVFSTATNTVGFSSAPLLGSSNPAMFNGKMARVVIYSVGDLATVEDAEAALMEEYGL